MPIAICYSGTSGETGYQFCVQSQLLTNHHTFDWLPKHVEVLYSSIDLKEEVCSIFQAAQGVMFLAGTVGIKIAIAKILGIADDVSQEERCFNKCIRTSYV